MVAEVLEAFKNRVEELRIVPGTGGIFEVTDLARGAAVFSKAEAGRFPDEGEVVRLLGGPPAEAH